MLLVLPISVSFLFIWSSSLVCSVVNGLFNTEEQWKHEFTAGFTRILKNHGINQDSFNELNQCLDELSSKLADREKLINEAKLKIDKIWVTNQAQTLETNVIVVGTVKVKMLNPKRVIITQKPVVQVSGSEVDLSGLERRFNRATREVNQIVDLVENRVVRKDRVNQVINGTIHFLSPIRADVIKIQSVRSSTLINGISLHELRHNVLRKSDIGRNQTVTGNWKFKNSNIFVRNLKVNGLLSGINMSNILLTNSPYEQVVTGRLKINRANFTLLKYEKINGIPKEELVLRSRWSPRITGVKTFTKVRSAANIKITGNLNGKNWARLVNNSVNIRSPLPIPTTLRFTTIPTINNLTARSVNGFRVDNLKAGLTPEELIQLSGQKTFRSISADRITLRGKLNDLTIEDDLVSLRSIPNLVEPIIFVGNVTFTSNLTVGTINGVDIVKDTVYRRSSVPQFISGSKIFERSVKVNNLRSIETRFRHINLDTLDPNAENGAQFARRSNVRYDETLTINGNLTVKRINGILIDELIGSLFSRTRDQHITWPTQFTGALTIGSVSTNQPINGLSIPQDLVQINFKGGEQVITGRKTFDTITLESENQLIMRGNTLNGFKLNSLEESVIKNDPSMRKDCYGEKSFGSVKVLGNIVAERVNGLTLERDVMLVDRPQNITGKLIFNSDVQAYQASFPAGLEVKTINGIPMDAALNDLVLADAQSVTLENKDFHGGLVADSIDLKGKINGVDLVNLLSSVVRLDVPQAVNSPLKFVDEIVFDHPIDTRSVNGADLQRTFSDFLKTSASSPDGIKIIGNVKINGDLITGRLNHQPTEVLKQFIFQPKTDNRFDRPVIFNSTVNIDHLTIGDQATLDDISPFDLLSLDRAVHLHQPVRIRGDAHIHHELIVQSGVINNCSLNDITLFSSYRNQSNTVHFQQPINFKSVNILGNLRLIGTAAINNIDVDQLSYQLQLGSPANQKFNSTFSFADDVHVDELYIEDTINGVNLREIYADSVQQSAGYQKITGHKTFKSLRINNGDVTFNGPVNLRGTINGFNVTKLYDNIIKPGTYNVVRGVKIFTSNQPIVMHDIETDSLSGVNLSDFASTTSTETIYTDTTFTKPVEMDSLQARTHYGRQLATQQSRVQFMDPVNVQQLNVKRINGIPIENFVSTLRDTQLNGSYTVDKLYIHGDLLMEPNSTINGVDLINLSNQSVDLRSSKFIPGSVTLAGQVVFEQGIDLINDTVTGPGASERHEKSLRNATNSLEMDLQKLEDDLKGQTMVLARAIAEIDMDKMAFESFDVFDYFNDFDIDTNHIEKISISKDYRPVNNSRRLNNQGLTQSIYLEYGADKGNKCDRVTSIFDLQPTNKQPALQDKLTNVNGKFFPLTTFQLESNNQPINVSAWTNLPDCDISKSDRKFESIVRFNTSNVHSLSTHEFNHSDAFSDVKYFVDGDSIILVTLRSVKTGGPAKITVYQCNPVKSRDQPCTMLSPSLDHANAFSMEMTNSRSLNSQLLAIVTVPVNCNQESKVFVYNWISKDHKFLPAQSRPVSASNPSIIKLIDIPREGNQRKMVKLIVANNLKTGICADKRQNPSSMVDIHEIVKTESGNLIFSESGQQSIKLHVDSISSFIVGQKVYLVLASKSADSTFIYSYNNVEKQFKPLDGQAYKTKGVEDVQCFWSTPNQLFMITTTTDPHKAIIYNAIFI